MNPDCLLCSGETRPYGSGNDYKRYLCCLNCAYVFLRPELRLDPEEEKKRYLLHNNDLNDPGYRKWIERFLDFALVDGISRSAAILDFGSGPNPALQSILHNRGYSVQTEDPFFSPQRPRGPFDLITALEVFEHLHHPMTVLTSIRSRLNPGGRLAISTEFLPDETEFSSWHYRSDPTHVGFFTVDALVGAARKVSLEPTEHDGRRYIAFTTASC